MARVPTGQRTRTRTLEAYEGYIRREIVPLIGGIELASLRPSRQAVADGITTANPVAAVKRPRM
jgi:hypothetical protein